MNEFLKNKYYDEGSMVSLLLWGNSVIEVEVTEQNAWRADMEEGQGQTKERKGKEKIQG